MKVTRYWQGEVVPNWVYKIVPERRHKLVFSQDVRVLKFGNCCEIYPDELGGKSVIEVFDRRSKIRTAWDWLIRTEYKLVGRPTVVKRELFDWIKLKEVK